MLCDRVRDLYLSQDYNCAETILRAANDEYDLGIDEKDLCLLSCFGAGMYREDVCGAYSAGLAVLGKILVKTRAHDTSGLARICSTYSSVFKEKLDSFNCAELKALYKTREERCFKTVFLAAEVLDEVVSSVIKK